MLSYIKKNKAHKKHGSTQIFPSVYKPKINFFFMHEKSLNWNMHDTPNDNENVPFELKIIITTKSCYEIRLKGQKQQCTI